MKKIILLLFLIGLNNIVFSQNNSLLKLWFTDPANSLIKDTADLWTDDAEWLKALPIGNGNIGAMVFGDVKNERVQLNEKTLWSGSCFENDNPDAPKYLDSIRNLLFNNKFKEATELTYKTQVCKGFGSGDGEGANVPYGCYQTLGDLQIDFENKNDFKNYYRDLDLTKAIANVSYQQDSIKFKREYFVSTQGNVLVIKFSSDKKRSLNFSVALTRPERYSNEIIGDELIMSGVLNNGLGGNGMKYIARLKAKLKGGSQSFLNNKMNIKNADEVILYFTASTDYLPNYPNYTGKDFEKISKNNIEYAFNKNYDELKKEHIDDYQKYFNRVSLQLVDSNFVDNIPTDERLRKIKETKNDNFLTQLYFQYGRYLLISSTRENTLPANLQGIWANKIQTPWNSDYHTNINVQMNYWLAENTNLSELHLSLINFIKSIEEPASKSAKIQFGLEGWCINPIVNIWGFTSPGEHPSWGLTTAAGGWICQHLWEHYAFTLDKEYLEKIYPTLKNAAKFYLGWLVEDKNTKKLVSGPASSPENIFLAPDGSKCAISMGPAHDQQIINELFTNFISASKILNIENEFVEKIENANEKLLKTQIASDGRLMEWAMPYKEINLGHRHISHVYGLYPGNAFNQTETPEYYKAAQKTIETRLANGGAQTAMLSTLRGSVLNFV